MPHVDHADHPESSMAKVERMAAELPVPTYAIDDETALKVVDGPSRSSQKAGGEGLRLSKEPGFKPADAEGSFSGQAH